MLAAGAIAFSWGLAILPDALAKPRISCRRHPVSIACGAGKQRSTEGCRSSRKH
jgi:hypothetical protein